MKATVSFAEYCEAYIDPTTIEVLFRCNACGEECGLEVPPRDQAIAMQARFNPCPHCGKRELRSRD